LHSTRPPPSPRKELVIPLLPPTSHRWRDREPSSSSGSVLSSSSAPSSGSAPSVEEQAVQELLQEARQSQEQTDDPCRPSISIPLQLQDGPLQPEPGPQDYQAVPVEAFGLAMLRGMGWNRGEGIGRTFKQVVKPLEHQLRPRGLGLGAQPT
ncbi:GPKOW protein, partial [Rhinopomastus cyanomelas]|nr:GPKOW protein [Rhinopomastus cyanomelas]